MFSYEDGQVEFKYPIKVWKVASSEPETSRYWIKPINEDELAAFGPRDKGIEARLVRPEPWLSTVGGETVVVPRETPCLVAFEVGPHNIIQHAYILGFISLISTSGVYL